MPDLRSFLLDRGVDREVVDNMEAEKVVRCYSMRYLALAGMSKMRNAE